MRRILKFLLLGLLVLVVVLAAAGTWMVRRAWPQTAGTIVAPGLSAPVEVVRDRWGVPGLYAANEHDLFFAQGFVHAQDRLWQMEFNRRVGAGELSTLFGAATLSADRSLRVLGIRQAAEADWRALSPETRAILQAYADGVNAFIASHRGRLPVEFTLLGVSPAPWTPVDSLAWSKMIAFSLGQNQTQELMRARLTAKVGPDGVRQLMPPFPGQDRQPLIVPPGAGGYGAARRAELEKAGHLLAELLTRPLVGVGSNNWVVHGSRTATGKPMLANDTHLELDMPSVWYENGLHAGRFDVSGFSFPGLPMVLIGHNRRIAWGISSMCGDSEDLFVEQLNDRRQVQTGDGWRDARIVHESIPVKGGKPASFDVVVTAHGPVINEGFELKGLPPLALRWTALDPGRTLDALTGINLAADWPAFRTALSLWQAPTLNFVYADVDGNIGYQGAGAIPVRAPGQQGLAPVPAGGPERDWRGFIPFDRMPSLLNPAAGFIVTANNKVVADSYPYPISWDYADPYRAQRITALLAANPHVTLEDMKRIQSDVTSQAAADLRPYLLAIKPGNPLQQRALEQVRQWDLRFTPESPGATIYFAWYSALLPDVYGDELGDDLMADFRTTAANQTPRLTEMMADPHNPWFDDKRTPGKVETRDDIVRRALGEAVALLSKRLGDDPAQWQWGKLHTILFTHQPFGNSGIGPLVSLFNGKAVTAGGEGFTVSATAADFTRPFVSMYGSTQRLIVDLGDLSRSLVVNSTGQSGLLFHRHREDQIPLWRDHRYRPMLYGRDAVEKAAEERLTLRPR
ncbi:MAG TPA: penicillin acylase family protein [Thermoanaerobaculia bacterium]